MFAANRSDDSKDRIDHIGCIPPSPKSCFNHSEIDLSFSKVIKGKECSHFKKSRIEFLRFSDKKDFAHPFDDLFFTDGLAIDNNPFAEGKNMRGGVEKHAGARQ